LGGKQGTTDFAAPRVYELLKRHLVGIDEASFAAPAQDLEQAVRAWYARRNATGHYGRFTVGDAVQMAQPWYKRALLTTQPTPGTPTRLCEPWLRTLREAARLVVAKELIQVGSPLI
jgi:hypothetical protein